MSGICHEFNNGRQAAVSEMFRSLAVSMRKRALNTGCAESVAPQVGRFVVPLIMGSLQQLPDLRLNAAAGSKTLTITLIARRSSQRPGVRHWRRGADPEVPTPRHAHSFLPSAQCACSHARCMIDPLAAGPSD